ncbi:MAG: DUF5362 family protein [Bacteroidetes bacterium]|nr:DUF5362 family protein [Bacteroidota bacterium]
MEILDENVSLNDEISIDNEIKSYLYETAKWAKFLAILVFVVIGLIVIFSLFMMIAGSSIGSFSQLGAFGAAAVGLVYLIIAILYFFPAYYLFNAAKHLKNALNTNNQVLFAAGFKNLKSHYRFVGIMMIVVLAIYAIVILAAVIGASIM